MISISELKRIYTGVKDKRDVSEISCNILLDFICTKFNEITNIFSKFDDTSIIQFCEKSFYNVYEENSEIFKKGDECNSYYLIVYGDINLYDEQFQITKSNNTLIKTISAGLLYGHKIKSNFNFFAIAKNPVNLISILKSDFDKLIEQTNRRKENFKDNFLKKFVPKFRMYTDDLIKSLKFYFIREQYEKYSKIIIDREYDEYVYIVINGTLGMVKTIKSIKNLKEKLEEINYKDHEKLKYIVLEKLIKGDVFGVYSALKHHKNNYSVMVLSDKAEIYKIPKSHCIYYFGGSSGMIPEVLKGIDSIQQVCLDHKLEILENKSSTKCTQFEYIQDNILEYTTKKLVDESEIENGIKDAWKELENLGTKINEFKMNLLKQNTGTKANPLDVFNKMKTQEAEVKDNTKLMGFGTNRVVGKTLNKTGLSSTQMKGMSTLQNICGVKKTGKTENEIIEKISAITNSEENPKKSKIFDNIQQETKETSNVSNSENSKKKFSLKNLII